MKIGNASMVLILLLFFTALSWYAVINAPINDAQTLKQCLEDAAAFEEKRIYIDARDCYEKALEIDPDNIEIILKAADTYYKLNDSAGYLKLLLSAVAKAPENPNLYLSVAEYYIAKKEYTDAIKFLKDAPENVKNDEEVKILQNELSTKYTEKYTTFSKVGDWHVQYLKDSVLNYIPVQKDGKWGLAAHDGTAVIGTFYEDISVYDSIAEVIPCCYEGEYYYINAAGYRKLVGDYTYQYLGPFGNGLAPAKRDGLCGYIDKNFNEYSFVLEYAGGFSNSVAAVKMDGKWALINTSRQQLTEFIYDEIIVDSNGFCSMFDRIVAVRDGKYILLDLNGKQIGSASFDEIALPAANNSYIAVKKDGLWGFSDAFGNVVIEPQYEDAKSFAIGLAPVKINGKWGYINLQNEMVIDAQYLDAGVFSSTGAAPIMKSNTWNFIILCSYES